MTLTYGLINGPNLGLLGKRQPEIYGKETLAEVEADLKKMCEAKSAVLVSKQSDSEGELVSYLGHLFLEHESKVRLLGGLVFNPGAYTHTSIALRDACEMFVSLGVPLVEVHLSNIFAREPFRHHSHISSVAKGVVCGLGTRGYRLAFEFLLAQNSVHEKNSRP
jgi:3-dehydroquinate dehydratase II